MPEASKYWPQWEAVTASRSGVHREGAIIKPDENCSPGRYPTELWTYIEEWYCCHSIARHRDNQVISTLTSLSSCPSVYFWCFPLAKPRRRLGGKGTTMSRLNSLMEHRAERKVNLEERETKEISVLWMLGRTCT